MIGAQYDFNMTTHNITLLAASFPLPLPPSLPLSLPPTLPPPLPPSPLPPSHRHCAVMKFPASGVLTAAPVRQYPSWTGTAEVWPAPESTTRAVDRPLAKLKGERRILCLVCLSVCLSVCLLVCLSVCLSSSNCGRLRTTPAGT